MKLIGRDSEVTKIEACIELGRNVLIEGPVGVGKTHLALSIVQSLKRPFFRVDGDSRYSEQKLSGWFDPPTVMKKGYSKNSFIPGPLIQAMQKGGVLFINELNRMPEGVQNVLLPAIDEKIILVPRLGEVRAKPGFLVIATQNPKEFVATSHLSEAILDRFEWIRLDYQTVEEEIAITRSRLKALKYKVDEVRLAQTVVGLVRATRRHPQIRRGASVRAAMSVAELAAWFIQDGRSIHDAVLAGALLALPTRIELERSSDQSTEQTSLEEVLKECLLGSESDPVSESEKKK